ncbi:MAG TPA: aspartyl protease [Nostocaceae cyanobacterium]|nr:aspartyl protease [Nostocaceae cyanobacterium]
MIEGNFGSDGEIFFEIDLITADELELPVTAMLDTGFTELLAINSQDIESLGWHFLRERPLKTAQGINIFRIYLGKVRIDGREFEIPVYSGEEITEVLLGSQWLKFMRLVADMSAGILTLEIK